VQLHHSVTGSANRTIGKHDPGAQSVEADPKKTVRLVGVLEYTLPPLQPTIEHKNERRQKWSLEAGCWPTRQPSEQDHLDTMRHHSRRAFLNPLAAGCITGALVAAVPVTMTALLAARSNRPEIAWTVAGLSRCIPPIC
jgi:hypothetical protein